jgi:hypothetical protein
MVTVTEFVVRLVVSVVDLFVIFLTEVALSDPLAFVSLLVGGALTTFAIGFFAYLTLGALLDPLLGDRSGPGGPGESDTIGRAPPPRD